MVFVTVIVIIIIVVVKQFSDAGRKVLSLTFGDDLPVFALALLHPSLGDKVAGRDDGAGALAFAAIISPHHRGRARRLP